MSDTVTRDALAQQLATLEQLQREVADKLREASDSQEPEPALPWLARRGTAKAVAKGGAAPRTLPPWLARRGR